MAKIPNSVGVFGPVAPNDSADSYATHLEEYGQGGYRTVASITERNNIPNDRRKVGMLVNVVGDKIYQLVGGITNSHWQEFVTGGNIDPEQIAEMVEDILSDSDILVTNIDAGNWEALTNEIIDGGAW